MRAERTSVTGLVVAQERGVALIAAMLIMMLMSALMIGFTTVVMSDQRNRGVDKDRARAFYGAQSGLEKLSTDLGNLFLTNVSPTAAQIAALANSPPAIDSVTFVAPSGVTAYGVTPVACDQAGAMTCNGTVASGPYAGLMALKKNYMLDSVARTSGGGEAHLTRKVESVAIPVFQFGMFSDVDLSFFAGPNFNFGGRVHTNGNLFLDEGSGSTLTLTDKVTAVKDVLRQRLQNGVSIDVSNHTGTVNMATSTNSFRPLLRTEGSLTDGLVPPTTNVNWPTVSLTTYNGYIRNGNLSNTPASSTGAKVLNLALITVGGANTDLSKRPAVNEDVTNPVLFGERMFDKVSLRILMSDFPADITNLPRVTGNAPVRLGDELGGLTNTWTPGNGPPPSNGVAFLGAGAAIPGAGGLMTPISRSPGVQTVTMTAALAAAGATVINVLGPFVVPAAGPSVYNSPNNLRFDVLDALNNVQQIIRCQEVRAAAAQFRNCLQDTNLGIAAVPAANFKIRIQDGTTAGTILPITAAVAIAPIGTTRNFTVLSTSPSFVNTFWMQSSAANQAWNVVTCGGVTATDLLAVTHNTLPNPVLQFRDCNNVPAANASVPVGAGPGITTNALVAQNVGTIGGYIKIEMQRADLTWQDVTMEILNWGFAAPNQAGTICNDPTPNAIIRLQRLRDNANSCHYSSPGTATNSVNSYDYWPNVLFDAREGLQRDTAPATNDARLGGVMHYVSLDVRNLALWFQGAAPYNVGSGVNALNNNGYGVYFSDRRNNRDLNGNGLETGEYGFEDVVNPLSGPGVPNGTLDTGEDVNGNTTVETYGQFPSFLGVRNNLPNGAVAPFNAAGFIRPTTPLGRSAAMTSRAYLFRRALKLINGGLGNIPLPGLTVITENPIYVQGDWNANAAGFGNPHAETSVIADAVTLLSNAWTDENSFRNPYTPGNRVRTTSWYRLAIIGGKGIAFPWIAGTPNDFGTDGGAHNFLRYLESGSTLNYRGAIATFYYNRQATGTYKCCNTVYSPPVRNYNFDTDFLNPATLPPLTPVFRDINALGFAQEIRPGK